MPKGVPVLHPFLFAIYPVLLLYQVNKDEVAPSQVVTPAATALVGAAVLFGIGFVIFRSAMKAGIVVTVASVLFFSYGHLRGVLRGIESLPVDIWRARYLLPLYAVVALATVVLVWRSSKRLPGVTKLLNILAVGMVATALASVSMDLAPRSAVAEEADPIPTVSPAKAQKRDIYYLVFDRYAGERTLREIYDFDNTPFLDYLRGKGFYVASESKANYVNTVLSLTSALNMRYLDDLKKEPGDDWAPTHELLRDNRVQRFLRARGYRYTHIGNWWEPTRTNPNADTNLAFNKRSEFESVLLETTALDPVAGKAKKLGRRTEHRLIPQYQFEVLGEKKRVLDDKPDFVFAHILLPHPPYVFDRNGASVSSALEKKRGRTKSYVEQLLYTNMRIRQLVETLTAVPEDKRPIILLGAEEGPYPNRWHEELPAKHQKVATPNKTDAELRIKFRILNTFYLPGVQAEQLNPSIGPVNTFRVVFNEYFGTDLPLLPERAYIFNDFDHRYDFVDVTRRIREVSPR